MPNISVVIITKNEADHIAACIRSAQKISSDIIVIDSGSSDATTTIAKNENARVYSVSWNGYGWSKNTGAALAVHDWILSLDADERITDELADSIKGIRFSDEHTVFGFRRINYFGNKRIRHGAFAHDRAFRLYNRRQIMWDQFPVHEKLTGENIKYVTIEACAIHYAIRSEELYLQKSLAYAILCAHKYQEENKKLVYVHILFSPVFNFIKGYIIQLGFLDTRTGFIVAKINVRYTIKKYSYLLGLRRKEKGYEQWQNSFQILLRKLISFLS